MEKLDLRDIKFVYQKMYHVDNLKAYDLSNIPSIFGHI